MLRQGARGESDDLPQAEWRSGVQAACCVSPTLVVCPGDKPPGEFRLRPDCHSDKGTDAQRRQVVRPAPLVPAPRAAAYEECPPAILPSITPSRPQVCAPPSNPNPNPNPNPTTILNLKHKKPLKTHRLPPPVTNQTSTRHIPAKPQPAATLPPPHPPGTSPSHKTQSNHRRIC